MINANTIAITQFESHFIAQLPQTYLVLRAANLVVRPAVKRIHLHGSRGLARNWRPDSDVDLSLIVDMGQLFVCSDRGAFLRAILDTTLSHWQGAVKPDLAIAFETRDCELRCFERTYADPRPCRWGSGKDCFGLFKDEGFVLSGLDVERIYPSIRVWRNKAYKPDT